MSDTEQTQSEPETEAPEAPPSNVTQSTITDPDAEFEEVGTVQEADQEAIIGQTQDQRQGLHGQDTFRQVQRDEPVEE